MTLRCLTKCNINVENVNDWQRERFPFPLFPYGMLINVSATLNTLQSVITAAGNTVVDAKNGSDLGHPLSVLRDSLFAY